jgi:hypothetical protein
MSHPYTPGRAYELGYGDRMQGKCMDGNVMQSEDKDIFKEEYVRGWNDANARVFDESRKKMESKPMPDGWSNGSGKFTLKG